MGIHICLTQDIEEFVVFLSMRREVERCVCCLFDILVYVLGVLLITLAVYMS